MSHSHKLAVIPMRNLVAFPHTSISLAVGRKVSLEAIKFAANSKSKEILLVTQQSDQAKITPEKDLYKVGVIATIEKTAGDLNREVQILLLAKERVKISKFHLENGAIFADFDHLPLQMDLESPVERGTLASIRNTAIEILKFLPQNMKPLISIIQEIDDLPLLINLISEHLDVSIATKQNWLETTTLSQRAEQLLEALSHKRSELNVQLEIQEKITKKLGKQQREAVLREQLRTIQKELGDTDEKDDLITKIKAAELPSKIEKIVFKEYQRLEQQGQNSPDAQVARRYIEYLIELPWKSTPDHEIDIKLARFQLDKDHYGLEKTKQRITEGLAVRKLQKEAHAKGNILLLTGPPGVGKTSIAESIAKTLGRKFVRVALGGVRDEAEIRGHRRTYIGAMPGRIIEGIKRAGSKNPVILLDEIDKLSVGISGDPSAALLEVLDPEQNQNFTDHYLDVEYDLSDVFFIATANQLDQIPGPLRDRMEIINLAGYTFEEKEEIAKRHLWPKQLEKHGIKPKQVRLPKKSLSTLIQEYTKEAGVRELERKLAAICRGISPDILRAPHKSIYISKGRLKAILGRAPFKLETSLAHLVPGVVTGLAWTPFGGDILHIEAASMPGRGKLILTGQLGEVMKESAQIAMSLIRSHLTPHMASFDIDKVDIHIHVPAGAVPKDGPSAGITILTALASLFLKKPIDHKLAMSGEITLRGDVLPVGGIKEKLIAAHRAGIKTILLSKLNEPDLDDLPKTVKEELNIILVEHTDDVLAAALGVNVATIAYQYSHLYLPQASVS